MSDCAKYTLHRQFDTSVMYETYYSPNENIISAIHPGTCETSEYIDYNIFSARCQIN